MSGSDLDKQRCIETKSEHHVTSVIIIVFSLEDLMSASVQPAVSYSIFIKKTYHEAVPTTEQLLPVKVQWCPNYSMLFYITSGLWHLRNVVNS